MNRVYYRGMIDFCNYACSYCPFAKKRSGEEKIEKEKASLQQLYDRVRRMQEVELMFTPYGEALVHEFYQEALIRFAKLPNVRAVGIQTNLSLDIEKFLLKIKTPNNKIKLWATYHIEYSNLDHFAESANQLSKHLELSVGMVASGENLEEIEELRCRLSPDIYLWLNAMDKRKHSFSKEQIMRHCEIDPMFLYEFRQGREKSLHPFSRCCSYDHLYIDNGVCSSNCFFKKKHLISEHCNDHKRCDCYLGYSNFPDTPVANFFGSGLTFRVPQKRSYKALFIDLDGILTNSNGQLRKGLESTLSFLSQKAKLYLATARSLSSTQKKLGKCIRYFSGGIFSDGALILDFEKGDERIIPLEKELLEELVSMSDQKDDGLSEKIRASQEKPFARRNKEIAKLSRKAMIQRVLWEDRREDRILRIRIKTELAKEFGGEGASFKAAPASQPMEQEAVKIQKQEIRKMKNSGLKLRRYGSRCYIQSEAAGKKNGMLFLMDANGWEKEEVFFISDNPQDDEVFEAFSYTATPMGTKDVEALSHYVLDLQHLGFIIR